VGGAAPSGGGTAGGGGATVGGTATAGGGATAGGATVGGTATSGGGATADGATAGETAGAGAGGGSAGEGPGATGGAAAVAAAGGAAAGVGAGVTGPDGVPTGGDAVAGMPERMANSSGESGLKRTISLPRVRRKVPSGSRLSARSVRFHRPSSVPPAVRISVWASRVIVEGSPFSIAPGILTSPVNVVVIPSPYRWVNVLHRQGWRCT